MEGGSSKKPSKKARERNKKLAFDLESDNPEVQKQAFAKKLASLRREIDAFGIKHEKQIAENESFRRHLEGLKSTYTSLARLCSAPEPYVTGDHSLTFQITNICHETKRKNGGLLAVEELRELLKVKLGVESIDNKSLNTALAQLKKLGLAEVTIADVRYVQSIPPELNMDSNRVMDLFVEKKDETKGTSELKVADVCFRYNWSQERTKYTLQRLVEERRLRLFSNQLQSRVNENIQASEKFTSERNERRALLSLNKSKANEKRYQVVASWLDLINQQLTDLDRHARNPAVRSLVLKLGKVRLKASCSSEEEERVVSHLSEMREEMVLVTQSGKQNETCWRYFLYLFCIVIAFLCLINLVYDVCE